MGDETCIICGGALTRPRQPLPVGRVVTGGEIMVCVACGSGQVTPRSARAGLNEVYDQDYYEAFGGGMSLAGGVTEASPKLKGRLAELERRFGKPAKLLDLGCATGVFVAYAQDRGWRTVGVEPSEWAAAEGRRLRGVEILTGTLDSVELEPGFDAIHANHVIEHVEDPVTTLAAAAKLLAPNGVVVAEVPYQLSVPFAEQTMALLGRPPAGHDSTYHLTFFSRRGLAEAGRRAGLRVEGIRAQRRESPRGPGALQSLKGSGLALLYRAEALSPHPNSLVLIASRA